jgi:hypothetical protein
MIKKAWLRAAVLALALLAACVGETDNLVVRGDGGDNEKRFDCAVDRVLS